MSLNDYIRDATGQVIGYVLNAQGKAPPRAKQGQIRKGHGPVFNIGPFMTVKVRQLRNKWKGFTVDKEQWVERCYRINVPQHGDLPIIDPDNPPVLRLYDGRSARDKGKRLFIHTYHDPMEQFKARVVGEGRDSGALVYMNRRGQLKVNRDVWARKGFVGIPIDVEFGVEGTYETRIPDMFVDLTPRAEAEAPEEDNRKEFTYVPEHKDKRVAVMDKAESIRRQLETALAKRRRGKELTDYETGLVEGHYTNREETR